MRQQPEFLMHHPNLAPQRRQRGAIRLPDIGTQHRNHAACGPERCVHQPED